MRSLSLLLSSSGNPIVVCYTRRRRILPCLASSDRTADSVDYYNVCLSGLIQGTEQRQTDLCVTATMAQISRYCWKPSYIASRSLAPPKRCRDSVPAPRKGRLACNAISCVRAGFHPSHDNDADHYSCSAHMLPAPRQHTPSYCASRGRMCFKLERPAAQHIAPLKGRHGLVSSACLLASFPKEMYVSRQSDE
jgi:hypothetical protein